MENVQNKNRIYVVLFICIGIVISIWLVQSNTSINSKAESNGSDVLTNPYRNLERNDDWKKILVAVDNSAVDTTLISKNNTSIKTEDDSTLTDQMSRDFLAQYLLAVKNNGGVNYDDANIIAKNTLSLPEYTESVGATYISTNLKINNKTDIDTLRIYRNRLYKIVNDRSSQIKDDPIAIVLGSMTSENEKDLVKLDYTIKQSKGFLQDLLALEVPKSAIQIHLALLNTGSNITANLEAMRLVLGDPVRGLAGISEYAQNVVELQKVLQNISNFFAINL